MLDLTRFEGCVLGHALGDALGAPVEFMTRDAILGRFGPEGVTAPQPWRTPLTTFRKGSWTDDTQMFIATAEGILEVLEQEAEGAIVDPVEVVYDHYLAWLATQEDPSHARYPGSTCLAALQSGVPGSTFEPSNDRKGAGGIMRVAPAGLVYPPGRAFEQAAEFAALTHGHPTGFIAAGAYADIVSRVARGVGLADAVAQVREHILGVEDAEETVDAIDLAVELFMSDEYIVAGIELIGEGWIAEESLGIALFCALNFPEDYAAGVLSAVNISGDSDTTGALTGALLGLSVGFGGIPGSWVMVLEEREMLRDLAIRLHSVGVG